MSQKIELDQIRDIVSYYVDDAKSIEEFEQFVSQYETMAYRLAQLTEALAPLVQSSPRRKRK